MTEPSAGTPAPQTVPTPAKPDQPGDEPRGRYLLLLSLSALGVVYGDIGTSPLYAMREVFHGPHAIAVTQSNVLGILSLIVWSLIVVISIKYLAFVMRADNRGEGGILALMALARPDIRGGVRRERVVIVSLGLFGAALLYGDGIITPAISVLSAVEGLAVATPVFDSYVIPITIGLLIGLFAVQRRGTAGIGTVFGPIVLLWFVTLAILGIAQILTQPAVLVAVSPHHAVRFFLDDPERGFLSLGTVFLVVTGGEALYADMGHFGARPIRLGWFVVALPALLINYFGQGALLIGNPAAADNPFYRMAPGWGLYPLIVLATTATSIASQAVISGAFSLTRQAVQLGYCPRLRIDHTSSDEIGQIYVPAVNWALMLGTIALVLGFRSSSNLAAAYGVAVTSTMVITTMLLYVVSRELWGWSGAKALSLTGLFIAVDLAFFGATALKIPHGGWLPLAVGAGIFTLMTTWKRGRTILRSRLAEKVFPLDLLFVEIQADAPIRVPGIAIFMTSTAEGAPPALIHNLAHNKVLHERVVLLMIETLEVPHVARGERVVVKRLEHGFYWVIARYGFMQDPSVQEILDDCKPRGLDVPIEAATFFLGRETLIATERPGMAIWRERLFSFMTRNATRATDFFRIPANQVFEVGTQVEI